MSLRKAIFVRLGAVLIATVVPLSTLAVVAVVEAAFSVPTVVLGGAAIRPTELLAALAVCQLAVRLYALNAAPVRLSE